MYTFSVNVCTERRCDGLTKQVSLKHYIIYSETCIDFNLISMVSLLYLRLSYASKRLTY